VKFSTVDLSSVRPFSPYLFIEAARTPGVAGEETPRMDRRRVIASAVVLATAGAAVALTIPAIASTDEPPAAPESEVVTALRRDLGLSADQAQARLRNERQAAATNQRLRRALADEWGGAWLNKAGDGLTIAVTDPSAAATVRAAGAQVKVVTRSLADLDTIKSALDRRARAAGDEVPGWYVDVATNSVVVLARPEAMADAALWAAKTAPNGSVRVIPSSENPRPLFDVRGADPYFIDNAARCSVGFSVVGGFVSAGHCGQVGSTTAGFNRQNQGVFRASTFPGAGDFSFVEVNGDWTPRPVVNTSTGGEVPVAGSTEAPVGSSICRSGSTTGTRCGVIQARNATVRYPEGTVTGLTRTNVCAEPGDSGGSWISGDQAQGITSGGSGDCTVGGTTFYQEVNEVLQTLNLTLVTTGGEQPAPPAPPAATPAPPAPTPPAGEPTSPPGGEEPAPPAACARARNAFAGSLAAAGARQIQPNGRFFRATAGRQSACLDGPDAANFDLFLQRWNGRRWATVARATGTTADEQLTFTGRAGFYRYRVVSESGSGAYTLAF
jgi:streptogrisin C